MWSSQSAFMSSASTVSRRDTRPDRESVQSAMLDSEPTTTIEYGWTEDLSWTFRADRCSPGIGSRDREWMWGKLLLSYSHVAFCLGGRDRCCRHHCTWAFIETVTAIERLEYISFVRGVSWNMEFDYVESMTWCSRLWLYGWRTESNLLSIISDCLVMLRT